MNLRSIITLGSLALTMNLFGETVNIAGTDYEMEIKQRRDIGPGTVYTRWRIPAYPLNVNVITADLSNPYVRVETMQANDRLGSTERFTSASSRLDGPRHKALGGANGNFWCVSGQSPWSDLLVGTTFGGNVRNGKIITETNAYSDQWCGGPAATCVIACDSYNRLWIEPMLWRGYIQSPKIPSLEVIQVNKVVRENELALYNSYYPADKAFQPVNQVDNHFVLTPGDATEVHLSLVEGQQWSIGGNMRAVVTQVRTNAGTGKLDTSDLALVGRGSYAATLAQLAPGDEITFTNSWTSYTSGRTPMIENLMQGLSLCMRDGVKLPEGNDNSYNNTAYPRTAYGSSADGKTLYIITVDKSADVWGNSIGCNTDAVCDIARVLGCANLSAVDGGGSTQMLVEGRVVNKTTEGTPRPIANGWMVFSTAPESSDIERIAFREQELRFPTFTSSVPTIIAYNQYGDVADEMLFDFTLTCEPAALGRCDGNTFTAAAPGSGTLTAVYADGIVASLPIEVVESEMKVGLNPILLDNVREYPVQASSMLDGVQFPFDPTELSYTIDNPDIAFVDFHGLLHGLREGETTLTASVGSMSDVVPVKVEIAPKPVAVIDDWNSWTAKTASGMGVISWTDGKLNYKFASQRQAKITISKENVLYSLPDALSFTFTTSVPVESIDFDLRTRNSRGTNNVTVLPANGDEIFAAGVQHTVNIPLPGDANDLATYPISFHKIVFNLKNNSAYKGEQTLTLGEFRVHYNNYSAVESITTDQISDSDTTAGWYNLQGIPVNPANLTPGLYIRRLPGRPASKILLR